MKDRKPAKKVSTFQGALVLIAMAAIMCVGSGVMGFSVQVLMTLCCAVTLIVAYINHWTWSDFGEVFKDKVGGMVPMFIMILGIGFLIGGLCFAGTVPVLVMWLANLISPKAILLLSFILPGIMSYCIGSNFAPTGTIGIIMFAVAQVQGIPAGLEAAAVLSGANIGQFMSPFADNPNMVAGMMDVSVYDLNKKAYWITIPSVIIAAILFAILGAGYGGAAEEVARNVAEFSDVIKSNFIATPIVLVPLILALILSFMKVNSVIMLYLSGAVGFVLGLILQGFSFAQLMTTAWDGFSTDFLSGTVTDQLGGLVNRGGLNSMTGCVIFTMIALVNVAMITKLGALDIFSHSLLDKLNSRGKMTLGTVIFTTLLGCATTDTYPTNTISTQFLYDNFEKVGIDRAKGGAIISITSNAMNSLLIPWSFGVIYCTGVMGVTPWEYLPYSFLAFILIIITIVFGFLGIGYGKKDKAAEVKA